MAEAKHEEEKTDSKAAMEDAVLGWLSTHDCIENTGDFLRSASLSGDHNMLVGVCKSLESSQFVKLSTISSLVWELTPEGKKYESAGTPEVSLFTLVKGAGEAGLARADAQKALGAQFKVALGQTMRNRWLRLSKDKTCLLCNVDSVEDEVQNRLTMVSKGALGEKECKALQKRKLVSKRTVVRYKVTKAAEYRRFRRKLDTDLTAAMVKSGAWKEATFKQYNWKAKQLTESGALHPLMKVRCEFRSILLEMGFEEMPTNNYVESSFWNFDALFQPQQHPARDMHDTFFIKEPANASHFPEEYLQRVKTMHERGGHGSIGYRYDWQRAEARKNLLRTHTTAVSSRVLYELAQGEFQPKRFFSIDRVFRNESLDATHLAEFHQVEGFVADYDLTLGDLIGVITTFFEKIGITDIRFKPTYNPYTEPSMEIITYSKELGREMEIGNSGIFRPEMLRPMGLPDNVRVIAWGLSLERPTMVKYGYDSIRELFGYKMNIKKIAENPIARFY